LCAHLAALAFLFQIIAIDHWHPDISDVVGVENSQAHVAHCHGASGSCADTAAVAGMLVESSVLPLPGAARPAAIAPAPSPNAFLLAFVAEHPPQHA
jgi:hypothetical protein